MLLGRTLLQPRTGRKGCSHGWSGAAALRPDAEPVENGYPSASSRPNGAKEILGPTKGRLDPAIPPPPRGGWVETRTFPRVPHRPLCSGPMRNPWLQSAAPLGRSVSLPISRACRRLARQAVAAHAGRAGAPAFVRAMIHPPAVRGACFPAVGLPPSASSAASALRLLPFFVVSPQRRGVRHRPRRPRCIHRGLKRRGASCAPGRRARWSF